MQQYKMNNIVICVAILVIIFLYFKRDVLGAYFAPATTIIAIAEVQEEKPHDDAQFNAIVMRNASKVGGVSYNEPPQANLMPNGGSNYAAPACIDDIFGPDNPDSIIRTRTFAYDLAAGLTTRC
jgi:hypothetical protein